MIPNTNPREGKKLRYDTLPEDWGCGTGLDMERMEEEELARGRFLKEGVTDSQKTTGSKQTISRAWTETEILSRGIVLSVVKTISERGKFMFTLQEELAKRIWKDESISIQQEEQVIARNESQLSETIPKEVSAIPVVKKNNPKSIKELFRAKELKLINSNELRLLHEERLENKRRLELSWKAKREH